MHKKTFVMYINDRWQTRLHCTGGKPSHPQTIYAPVHVYTIRALKQTSRSYTTGAGPDPIVLGGEPDSVKQRSIPERLSCVARLRI